MRNPCRDDGHLSGSAFYRHGNSPAALRAATLRAEFFLHFLFISESVLAAPDTSTPSEPGSDPLSRSADTADSLPGVVTPSTWRGWCLLLVFLLLVVMGIWPVIGWVNQQPMSWGMPPLIVWSYLIIFACSAAMLLGNRLLAGRDAAQDEEAPRD